ncbi:unnamed protein product [Penicillium pancosmium]
MDVPGFALITGPVSGIGRTCTLGFTNEGTASLALLDLSLDALSGMAVNVTNKDEVTLTVPEVARKFERLNYVVNAAGIATKHPVETNDWQRILNFNPGSSFIVLGGAAKIMLQQNSILSSVNHRDDLCSAAPS